MVTTRTRKYPVTDTFCIIMHDIERLTRTLNISQKFRFGPAVAPVHSRAKNGQGDASAAVIGGRGASVARRESTSARVREPATILGGREPSSQGRESRSRAATPTFHRVVLPNDGSPMNAVINIEDKMRGQCRIFRCPVRSFQTTDRREMRKSV